MSPDLPNAAVFVGVMDVESAGTRMRGVDVSLRKRFWSDLKLQILCVLVRADFVPKH